MDKFIPKIKVDSKLMKCLPGVEECGYLGFAEWE